MLTAAAAGEQPGSAALVTALEPGWNEERPHFSADAPSASATECQAVAGAWKRERSGR